MALIRAVYEVTNTFLPQELYGLAAQISRLITGLHKKVAS